MANLAQIQSIAQGQFFVKDSLGNLTELKVGDTVSLNDTIVAASSNTDLSKIEILFDTNELITLSQGEQLLDTTLLASTFGNEELAFDKQEVDETLNAWNNAQDGDETDMETAAGDVTEQATNAGDERAADGGALRSKFNSRDGDATDIVSDLREASWTGGIERTIEDSENMLLEQPLPVVYTIIEGIDVVNEGDSANYVVKLQDAAGNPVIATQDTIIYVRYTNKTTQDGDTQYNNENIIEVVIKAGTSQTEFTIKTNDDYLADNGEIYNVSITGNNSTEFDMRTGDVNGDKTNVDTKILDNSNPSNPGGEDGGYGSEDTVYAIIEGTTTVNEGNEATYTVKLVDKDGNVVTPTKDTTVTVVYKDKTTNDGLDTNKSNGEKITVVIKANETSAEFKVETKDDYLADNGEVYNVSIEKVEDQGQFEKVNIGDVNGDKTNVDTKILDNSNPSNPGGEDGGYGSEDTVYAIIEGTTTVNEGNEATYTVKLVDKDGNVVTPTKDTTVTVVYKDKTTNDGLDTNKSNGEKITVVIKANETLAEFKVETKDDYLADNGEVYNVSIEKVEDQGQFEKVNIGDVNGDKTNVDTKILDNSNPSNPGGEDGGYGSEDTVYAIIEGTTTVNEGNEATYTVKLVDKDGNVVTPTKDTTVTVVYKDKTTNDGLDTNKSNGEKITVVIKANETLAEFKVETKDDYLADNGEVYNVSIEKVEDQGQFEKVNIGDVNGDKTNVDTKILDNSNPSNPGGEDGGYGSEDTVYAIITGETTVNEGGVVTYTVKLVDKDGNTVIPTKETTVTVTYTNIGTTSTDDTNKTNNQEIAVKIDASGKGTFTVETKDDYYAEADENYNVKITNVQNTGEFENVKFDSYPNTIPNNPSNNVTTTIKDNPSKVEQPDTGTGNDDPINGSYGKEDTVYVKIEGNPTVVEGGKLSHTVTLVDKDGKAVTIPAGESVTVTLTYKEPANDKNPNADDYVTKTETITIKGGTSSTTFENITKVDFVTEGKEVYEITISKVEQSGAFENVAIDSTANKVTDTILDGITFGTPVDSKVDEDNFYQNDLNGTDGGNVTKSNLTASESLGITIPAGYEDIVGEYKINFNGEPKVMVDGQDYELKSNGVKVVYEVNGDKIVGKAGSKTVFDIVLNKTTGKYEYKQYENIDHPKFGEVSTEEGLKQNNTLDDIVLNFQFNITTTSKNGQTVTSPSQEFKVTVNDSTPIVGDQNLVVYEDNSLQFIISDEGFKGNTIEISNDGGNTYKTLTTSSKNGANFIDILENGQKIGTLKNLGSGKLQFIPEPDYSKYSDDNLPNFKYKVYDTDGDYAEGKVNIKVKPVADTPTLTVKNIETTEDYNNTQEGTNKVALELIVPSLSKDQTDKNNATGDSPERNGEITLKFTNGKSVVGATLYSGDTKVADISTNNQEIKVVIVKTSGETDIDTTYHHSGTLPAKGGNVLYLTKEEYESLKIQHAEDNDTNIQINIGVTSYEVNDNGEPLFKNSSYDDNNNSNLYKNSNATMTVVIKPVTDDIELKFDTNSIKYSELQADGKFVTKEISGTISSSDSNTNKADTFTLSNTIKEGDGAINLQSILSATSGALNGLNGIKADLDGSEIRTYKISDIPAGTVIVLDGKSYTVQDGKTSIEIPFPSNTKADPTFTMKFPENFSGEVKATITLSVIDKGVEEKNDSTKWGETKEETVYLNLNVTPVADDATVKVGQPVGYEDAGREGGNTKDKSGAITNPTKGIVLPITVTSTDKDGSETFTVTIKDIPDGGAIFVKEPLTGKDILVTYAEDGTPTIKVWNNGVLEDYTGTTITANKGTITIEKFDNENPPKFIPPHNEHGDFKLNVDAKTVDTVIIDGQPVTNVQDVATNKDILVVVKDVADSVVGNEYNKENLSLADGTNKDYNLITQEDTQIKLDSVFKDSTKLSSYDKESEDLTIILKSLPKGVELEGNVTLINGQYIFKASDIPSIKIVTPANYSGELNFDVTYITTEKGEANNPSKTHDSKQETDKISIFVKPTIDAQFDSQTTKAEDSEIVDGGNSYYKVDLGISHQNGDNDETLESVTIKAPEANSGYKLFIIDGNTKTEITSDYTLKTTELNKVYVEVKENQHGSFDIKGTYTVKDSQYAGKDVNYETKETKDFTHKLTITPVTDTPTIEVETGTQTHVNVNAGENTEIKIPVKVSSEDTDGSENITKIVISGVPKGVTIETGSAELDAKITVSEHNGIYTITGHNLNSSNFKDIVFKIDGNANFEYRDITITAYTKDAQGSIEEQTSTKITLDKTHNGNGGGTGTGPKLDIIVDEVKKDFNAKEDTEFNFLDVFKVTVADNSNDGRTELNFKIDVGSNATLKGLDAYKNADGSYTIKGNRADIESVLANLKVVPNKDFNSNQDADGISIKVETNGKESTIKVPVIPVTDSLNVEITANDSTTIDENGEFNFDIKLMNNSDKEFTNINDFYVVVNENFEAGESSKGELYLGNTKLELVDGKYKLPADYKLGDSLNLTYKSGEDRHGAVEIKVIALNKETGATNELTSTGTTTIIVKPVASSEIEVKKVQDGIEDKEMASAKLNVVKADPSEKFESVLIKVASGVAIYYNEGKSLAMNLGDGSWLVPVNSDGTLPQIFFKGNEHFGGEIKFDAIINVKDGNSKSTIELKDSSVYIKEVADGVTIDPTKTGIDKNAFEWTSLNLNANMKDLDGSEKMHFTLEGLDSSAQFRIVDKDGNITDLSSQSKFENGKWTINGIEAKDINSIEISHDKSVSGVKVEASTVDGDNVSTSPSVSGTFDLSYKADAKFSNGSFTLAKDMDIDFNNIGKLGFTNVEKIDLGAGNGKNELLNLTLQDVLDMGKKDGGNINLTILGDSQDKVSFADKSQWQKSETTIIENGKTFTQWSNISDSTVTLKIEQPISDGITN
ncbi:hypothetical protein [Aliarcobacter cryaerophilus]|uniref:Uncharacterized protein n=5 Tax=Arcobacteraceae TaxID=2808963 RepID=A0AA96DSV0_9BACT|nr:hypothetical protein RMP68_06150 [Arcobacter sp. AZ-2023]WNL35340.1 hypothetical protein RMQ66_06485 [Arcobacter sp. AZ-2023]